MAKHRVRNKTIRRKKTAWKAASASRASNFSRSEEGRLIQTALQTTWLLKGTLKNARLSYIRVGVLLAKVRDEKLYVHLKHPDMFDYAEKRLHLGRTSLYQYLQVHDWIVKSHPEWLQPKPKGFIPDLSDAADLIWIETELARKDLDPKKRAILEALQKKALEGRLRQGELDPLRKREHTGKDGLKSFLSKLKFLRMRGAELANMPAQIIELLDTAIGILKNDNALKTAGLYPADAERRGIC